MIDFLGYQISHWFLFGWLNIFLGKSIFLYLAFKRSVPFIKLLLLTIAYTIGAGLGAIFINSIVAVLAGAVLFFLIFKRLLNVSTVLEDLLAINFAILLSLGRIGCFLSGCCFGTPTTLPWGVFYGNHTIPHFLHSYMNLIPAGAPSSATIHPVQLYESLFVLLLGLLCFIIGKNKPALRSILLTSFIGVYFIGRFFLEFIKAFSNTSLSMLSFSGINGFQWLIISLGIGFLIGSYFQYRRFLIKPKYFSLGLSTKIPAFLLFLLLVICARQFHPIHLIQVLVLSVILINVVAVEKYAQNKNRLVWVPGIVSAVLLIFVFPIQTAPDINEPSNGYHRPQVKSILLKNNQMVTIQEAGQDSLPSWMLDNSEILYTIKGGHYFSAGANYHQVVICGSIVPIPYAGASYNYKKSIPRPNSFTTYGLKATGAYAFPSYPLGNFSGFIQQDFKKVGIGLGGSIVLFNFLDDDIEFFPLPGFHLRLGSLQKHFSVGFMDMAFSKIEPISGHISYINGNDRIGITNFYMLPAFYFDKVYEDKIVRIKWTPPIFDASMGIGVTYQWRFR